MTQSKIELIKKLRDLVIEVSEKEEKFMVVMLYTTLVSCLTPESERVFADICAAWSLVEMKKIERELQQLKVRRLPEINLN